MASWFARSLKLLNAPGVSATLVFAFFGGIGLYASTLNGEYSAFVATQGTVPDFLARAAGFGVKGVTISGAHELPDRQILDVVGIRPTNSLPFLNAAQLRDKLIALPIIKNASVSKLYPNRVMIEVEERKPFALWQKDGVLKVIAADGTPIPGLDESRFTSLPLVVGDDANLRISDYAALLDAAADLRPRIKAGMLIADRRWTLKMTNGIEVKLPEDRAPAAIAELVTLQHKFGVLDKNIVALDLRFPGRLIARLPEPLFDAQNAKGSQT
ncbi:MAG TPA: FtsQ-type POTRA domain-containing protein [Methylovirgula sp.]|nr:FtsQ-type POTRA domain-containing protein [Methylovirgula sp.]